MTAYIYSDTVHISCHIRYKMNDNFSINELCTLTDLSLRTVRYYVQQGLVDHPIGERKNARYGRQHVEQLLTIKKWQAAGLSLERIKELLTKQDDTDIPPRPKRSGMVEVWSHLHVADGIEIQIEPGRAALSPEQIREFLRNVMSAYTSIKNGSDE